MKPAMPWFRFYTEALEDRKVQSLPGDLFKSWVNVLCVARRNSGVLPSVEDTAFALRITTDACSKLLKELEDRVLLDRNGDRLSPHNFAARQFESDVSTARVKRFRERSRNVSETANETAPETDTETDTESEQRESERARAEISIPEDWRPSAATTGKAKALGLTDDDLTKITAKFKTNYRAKGTKRVDWDVQFEGWCVEDAAKLGRKPPSAKPANPKVHVKMDTPQWAAWEKHKGKRLPNDSNFGWYFDSEWPPEATTTTTPTTKGKAA
jgi:hypothetical protein